MTMPLQLNTMLLQKLQRYCEPSQCDRDRPLQIAIDSIEWVNLAVLVQRRSRNVCNCQIPVATHRSLIFVPVHWDLWRDGTYS